MGFSNLNDSFQKFLALVPPLPLTLESNKVDRLHWNGTLYQYFWQELQLYTFRNRTSAAVEKNVI